MGNLKKKTSDLLASLKRIEDKQTALRAAIAKRDARLEVSRNALRVVEQAIDGKLTNKPKAASLIIIKKSKSRS